jgi:hypothetical protein
MTITLTLRPLPSTVPEEVRVRRALKMLLRTTELRCIEVAMDETPMPPRPSTNVPTRKRIQQ